jgi:hypothetical protein
MTIASLGGYLWFITGVTCHCQQSEGYTMESQTPRVYSPAIFQVEDGPKRNLRLEINGRHNPA